MITRYKINNLVNIYVATRPGEILRLYKKLVQSGYCANIDDTIRGYGAFTITTAKYTNAKLLYSVRNFGSVGYVDMDYYCKYNDMYTLYVNNFNETVEVLKSREAFKMLRGKFNRSSGAITRKARKEYENGSNI